MAKTVFKMAAMILGALWYTVTIRCSSVTDGTTFEPYRFLHQLGLDRRPKPDLDAVIPDYMIRMYKQSTEKYLMPGVAIRSIKLKGGSANSSSCDRFSFLYDLSSLEAEDELLHAAVRLPNVFAPNERPSLLLTSGRVRPLRRRPNGGADVVFAVTDEVALCRALHSENDFAAHRKCAIVLEVRLKDACRGLNASLVVVTRGRQGSSRVTRASDPRPSPRRPLHERLCQRKEMYVDFRKIGWSNWIIAPDGYSAFYCAGSCPFPISEQLNTTNHAIIQTLAHSVEPHRVAATCCVPTHFAPISMLYYDNQNNVVLKQYDNMVVDACGCR